MEQQKQEEKTSIIHKSVPAITRLAHAKLAQVKEGQAIVDISL